MKIKIIHEGQPCRKCNTPVVKRIPEHKKLGAYYYDYYFDCPNCRVKYMVNLVKHEINPAQTLF